MRLLEIKDLHTYYYTSKGIVRAVNGVTQNIERGEALGLVGESGSGKTTVAYSVVRLLPENGQIVDGQVFFEVDGRNVNLLSLPDDDMRRIRGKSIAMVFQDPMTYLNPAMKIYDQIAEPLIHHQRLPRSKAREDAVELLAKVGIPDPSKAAMYYPHQLSGGMRQRVLIAIAISCNPDLLIADEPTTALDVTIQAQILELIQELQRKLGMSLLLITHDLGIVAEVCDRVAIMHTGQIVEAGDVRNIYKNPKHPYTVSLLEAAVSVEAQE